MTVGDRIKSARESAGITQSELGKVCGTTKQTIYKYENNVVTNIPLDKLEKIAEVLNTTPSYLMGWENTVGETDLILAAIDIAKEFDTKPEAVSEIMASMDFPNGVDVAAISNITKEILRQRNLCRMPSMVKVPRIGTIACGQPILAEQNIECYDSVPDYVKCDFALACKGDSMINARIFDGDIVCIRAQETVENGEIAAVMVGAEEATLKRVRLFEDHISLEPENPMYKPLVFWNEDMNQIRIIGKATHFISAVR